MSHRCCHLGAFTAAILLILGCAGGPATDGPARSQLPLGTLSENLFTTHYSALVKVDSHRLRDDTARLTGAEHLTAIEYSAAVLETYRGEERPRITYLRFVEPGARIDDQAAGEVIVSLCRERGGAYLYLPHADHQIPSAPGLVQRARDVSNQLSSRGAEATAGHACR